MRCSRFSSRCSGKAAARSKMRSATCGGRCVNACYRAVRQRRPNVVSAGDRAPLLEAVDFAGDRPDERIAIEQVMRALPAEQREVVHPKASEGWIALRRSRTLRGGVDRHGGEPLSIRAGENARALELNAMDDLPGNTLAGALPADPAPALRAPSSRDVGARAARASDRSALALLPADGRSPDRDGVLLARGERSRTTLRAVSGGENAEETTINTGGDAAVTSGPIDRRSYGRASSNGPWSCSSCSCRSSSTRCGD